MAKYLIDANLPYYFFVWHNEHSIHVKDLDDTWPDNKIWEYAKENHLTIITKDADFSNRILSSGSPPKVIHIRIGNMKIAEFHKFLSGLWSKIEEMSEKNNLVTVYLDRIEGIR